MIMHLDYQFHYEGNTYTGYGVDIGDTDDINNDSQNIEDLKISAICHEFNLTIDDEIEINQILKNSYFDWCELQL